MNERSKLMLGETNVPSLIACGIFKLEITQLIEQGALRVKPYFLNPGLHNDPPLLEKALRGLLIKQTQRNAGNVIVMYGNICLGFKNEMAALVDEFNVVKVNAMNCIDCYLGGEGRLLKIDPNHEYFFLNPSWIELEFGERDLNCPTAASHREFDMLKGLYLLDTLNNLDQYEAKVQKISGFTNLPVVAREDIGLDGLKQVLDHALGSLSI
jgi:Protein of unknown function (DUF1638)